MKLLTVIVDPARAGELTRALTAFGVPGFTVSDAYATVAHGSVRLQRGRPTRTYLRCRSRVELVVDDADAADVLRVIVRVLADGGRVWVTPVVAFTHVRTGRRGIRAL